MSASRSMRKCFSVGYLGSDAQSTGTFSKTSRTHTRQTQTGTVDRAARFGVILFGSLRKSQLNRHTRYCTEKFASRIEDCVHAVAQAAPLPALSSWLPDRSFLLLSFSKVVAPGLRVGFLEAAPEWLDKLAGSIRADSWMVAPLMPEIATHWIDSGEMDTLIAKQRKAVNTRLEIARQVLDGLEFRANDDSPLVWLPLPEPWRAGQFAAALRQSGVLVRTAEHFAVGRSPAPHAIRISLNTPQTSEQVAMGLGILKSLIHHPPAAPMDS